MSAEAFGQSLLALGIRAEVEPQGKIALLRSPVALDRATRRKVVALGRENGFSSVAVELEPDENLPGD